MVGWACRAKYYVRGIVIGSEEEQELREARTYLEKISEA
jgi:hypothetical protein